MGMNSVFKIPSQILCQGFVDDDDDISILSIGSCGETFFNKIVDQPIQSSRCSHPPPTCKRLSYPSQILRGLSNLVFYDEEESIDASRILVQWPPREKKSKQSNSRLRMYISVVYSG